ncbi:tight adherence protein C [Agrococcus baldri]|uniref:Tight adherence protein C n=1 Tax=Agrococcus baldri TaxID=153730 RepID=A0AA94HK55_9MICO|nr:type II secretion system F family protein [Agrococcus baldri]SFR98400.1 tight adherence protein C [Agrococcus baldri]
MPTAVILACLLVAVAVGAIVWVMADALQPARAHALANLQRGQRTELADGPKAASDGLPKLARRLTVPTLVAVLERQHARAGRPADWTVDRLLALKLLWVPTAIALFILMFVSGQEPLILLIVGISAVVVYFVPDLLLLSRGQERDQLIQKQLADTLDQMTIAVEAGLGFDAAMTRAASNGKGALAEELTRTLQDMRMGRSRKQAFHDLADRSHVSDLRAFVRAILQADAYGISIGDVLRTQADEMRLKRRQRAEEKAQQVPVKVLMPLMLCILPVLFIAVMAPAVMDMIDAFSGM